MKKRWRGIKWRLLLVCCGVVTVIGFDCIVICGAAFEITIVLYATVACGILTLGRAVCLSIEVLQHCGECFVVETAITFFGLVLRRNRSDEIRSLSVVRRVLSASLGGEGLTALTGISAKGERLYLLTDYSGVGAAFAVPTEDILDIAAWCSGQGSWGAGIVGRDSL